MNAGRESLIKYRCLNLKSKTWREEAVIDFPGWSIELVGEIQSSLRKA